MNVAELLVDGFSRVQGTVHAAVEGLTADQLRARLDDEANSIAWLVWHAARVQDAQLAPLAGTEEVWVRDGWVERFGLDLDPDDHGYGHSSEQVGKVRASAELLAGYLRATHEASVHS